MKKTAKVCGLNILLLFFLAGLSFAAGTGIAVRVNTLGADIDVDHAYSDSIAARVGLNYFTYSYDAKKSNIDYDLDLKLKSLALLLDWHPGQGSFRISGGVLWNGNKVDADAKSSTSYKVGDNTYTSAELGKLTGDIEFNKVAPYLGLGWDTSFGKDGGWGFVFEIGAVYQGSANVDLSATGTLANDPTFKKDLAKEESDFEDDLSNYKIYPVVALGVSYRF